MEITVSKKGLKRALSLFMAVLLVMGSMWTGFGVVSFAADETVVESGFWGDNITYTLYGDGRLVLEGEGEMQDGLLSLGYENIFWSLGDYDNADLVESIEIAPGITSIGKAVFCYFSILKSVEIPDEVTSIGDHAFQGCANLTDITIPDGVTSIGDSAFNGCESLKEVTIPDGVKSIGAYAFAWCFSLDTVYYNGTKAQWGDVSIGSYNTGLIDATIFCSDGVINNGNVTDGNVTDGNVTDGNVTDGNVTDGNVTDGNVTDGNVTGGNIPEIYGTIEAGETKTLNAEYNNEVYLKFVPEETSLYKLYAESEGNTSVSVYNENMELITEDFMMWEPYYDFSIEAVFSSGSVYYFGVRANRWKKSMAYDVSFDVTLKKMCGHMDSQSYDGKAAACTEDGYTEGVYCYDCETWIEGHEEIPAKGHSIVIDKAIESTCTETGLTEGTHCSVCGEVIVAQEVVPAKDHTEVVDEAVAATCTETGLTEGTHCSVCGEVIVAQEIVLATGHTNETTTTRATLTKNGKTVTKCSVCGEVENTVKIYYPKTIELSSTEVTYNGKTRTPSVTVKDTKGKALIKDTDYTVTYESGRKLPGQYIVTVEFKGNYSGTKKLTFTILPKASATISATQSTSAIKLTWSASTGATGYRVYQYSPSKGKYVVIASVKGVTTYRKSTNLKPGTTYKFKIKPYTKLSDGTVLWGDASDAFVTATECKAPSITSVTSTSKSKATVKWSNVSGETGYQLYYATSKNGTYKKIKSYGVNTVTGSKTFSASASGKTIYLKVRAYSKVNGQTIFSEWSAVKSVKLK